MLLRTSTLLLLFAHGYGLAARASNSVFTKALYLAPNLEQGRSEYLVRCSQCHGEKAWGTYDGEYPQLAGQHAPVIIKQLSDYLSRLMPPRTGSNRTKAPASVAPSTQHQPPQGANWLSALLQGAFPAINKRHDLPGSRAHRDLPATRLPLMRMNRIDETLWQVYRYIHCF